MHTNNEGDFYLHLAIKYQFFYLLKRLISLKVNLNVCNQSDQSCLILANLNRNLSMIKYLLAHDVYLEEKNYQYLNARMLTKKIDDENVLNLLEKHGASFEHSDDSSSIDIPSIACLKNQDEMQLKIVLEKLIFEKFVSSQMVDKFIRNFKSSSEIAILMLNFKSCIIRHEHYIELDKQGTLSRLSFEDILITCTKVNKMKSLYHLIGTKFNYIKFLG